MAARSLNTRPSTYVMATTDIKALPFDPSDDLLPGESVTSASAEMVDSQGTVVVLSDTATLAGNVITQIVRGTALTAESRYVLTWIWATSVTDETTATTRIYVQQ